ncbi:MAG: magnesium/cobalt transporter CorA [Bacteroidetes bacterium]|nr:magnesium/cobalt transporter CorA [Bacteroidota bacterium]
MKKSHSQIRKQRVKKNKLSQKAGLPPGTIVHVGKENTSEVVVSMLFYNAEIAEEKQISDINECRDYQNREGVTWINVIGIHKTDIIESVGKFFNLHPLVLEDIANTEQRPKFEEFDNYIFFTLKNLKSDNEKNDIAYEHVSFVFGKNYVISFQENDTGIFNEIKKRIISGISRAKSKSTDYLVYLLIDATIDSYYEITENIEDKIEFVEDEVLADNAKNSLTEILIVKRDLVVLLKSIFPLREAIGKLQRSENKLIADTSRVFFNSIYDHTVHIIESVESQRDILSGLMDIYLTNISNRMNSIMKVLTIIATIFIPLTFFAGVYGMNFKFFPEIGWQYGYLYFWILCIISISIMFWFFRKKRWL